MAYLLVAFVILVGQLVPYTLGLNLCQIVYLVSVVFGCNSHFYEIPNTH